MSIKVNAARAVFGDKPATFVGKLSDVKEELREEVRLLTWAFLLKGTVTVCKPAVAIGSGFSPNKHPRNGIVGVQSPLTV